MATYSFIPYKLGINRLSPAPTEPGAAGIDNNFQTIADLMVDFNNAIDALNGDSGLFSEVSSSQVLIASSQIDTTDGTPVTPFTVAVGGGNVLSTATPLIDDGRDGQLLILRNDNQADSDGFILSDKNHLAGSNLRLTANTVTMQGNSMMGLIYSEVNSAWIQQWYVKLSTSAAILTFTVNIGNGAHSTQYIEVASGGTLTPTFALTYIGTPTSGTINSSGGESGYPHTLSSPYTSLVGNSVNKGTSVGYVETFTPNVVVNGTHFIGPTASITYINTTYVGPNADSTITSSDILTLATQLLKTSVAGSYSVTVSGSNYLWLCHPSYLSDLNTIKDNSTGFAIDGGYQTNVSHTNASGFTGNYRVWRSTNVGIFPSGGTVVVT